MKKKIFKTIAIVIIVIIAVPLISLAVLRGVYAPILRVKQRISEPGIDLMEMVEIGGIKQALYFRGESIDNPVILFLHGGPGGSTKPFIHTYQYDWEKDFTVVNWDQRNAGKTYFANDADVVRETMGKDRVISDAYEVTQYIKQKLNKDKIIVMGHSWGSVLGTMLVQTYPDEFSAYISVGQVINIMENERIGYERLLDAVRASGNQKDITAIEALAPYPPQEGYSEDFVKTLIKVRQYQTKYKLGFGLNFSSAISVLTSPYSKLREIGYFLIVDSLYYQGDVVPFLFNEFDVHNYGLEYDIPVYYIMGEDDWQTPYSLAKEFFPNIIAPDKEFFSIPGAGHMTMSDNKEEFTRVLRGNIKPRLK